MQFNLCTVEILKCLNFRLKLNLSEESTVDETGVSSFVIDDQSGLVVVHPDQLLSGTSIVSSLFCMRKAVLSERFKGLEGEKNKSAIVQKITLVASRQLIVFFFPIFRQQSNYVCGNSSSRFVARMS